MSYVVLVRPAHEDHPAWSHIYGPFKEQSRADAFLEKVREAVDACEEHDPYGYGYSWVLLVRKPRVREAKRLATEREL